MENASKALIIAGAILISILLISVGIIIMNSINDPVQQGADSAASQAITIFNSRFTGYAGKGVDYNTAKQCIVEVNSTKGGDHKVNLTGEVKKASDLDRDKKYDIDFEDNDPSDGDGYYDECIISESNG